MRGTGGRRVVVGGGRDIVVIDEIRITRFTFDASLDRYPIWSPDGRTVVFDSDRGKGRHLVRAEESEEALAGRRRFARRG